MFICVTLPEGFVVLCVPVGIGCLIIGVPRFAEGLEVDHSAREQALHSLGRRILRMLLGRASRLVLPECGLRRCGMIEQVVGHVLGGGGRVRRWARGRTFRLLLGGCSGCAARRLGVFLCFPCLVLLIFRLLSRRFEPLRVGRLVGPILSSQIDGCLGLSRCR